jgi:hypothetical protein
MLLLLLFLGALAIIKAKAQQSDVLPEFTKIKINGVLNVELIQADRHSIFFENGNIKPVEYKVNNGVLMLDGVQTNQKANIKVYFKTLDAIVLDAACSVTSSDTMIFNNLSLSLDGTSKAQLIVNAQNISTKLDGFSNLTLSGKCSLLNASIDGASQLQAKEMETKDANINTDGASKAKVFVNNRLSAKADGASAIGYSGNPQIRNFSVDGMAKITDSNNDEQYGSNNITDRISKDGDTTRLQIKIGKKKRNLIIVEDKEKDEDASANTSVSKRSRRRMKPVWGGFSMGVQGITTPNMSFDHAAPYKFLNTNVGKSWFFDLNLPEIDGHIIRNKLAITAGLGFSWNNIHFEGNNFLAPNTDTLSAITSTDALSKNKLYTFDITAPLLIKFAPGNARRAKKGFHFAAGAIVHYVTSTTVVTETSSRGYKNRAELEDDFNINPFRVDATVRIGYDRIKLFANYSLTPFFNSSKAPDVRLFSAGFTVFGF